jgi:PKD repeat protein
VNNGTYTVTLTVSDVAGLTSVASTTATIANVAPTGTFVIPSGALENTKAVLSFSGVTDPGTNDVLQYAFDCGDGKGYGALSSTNNRPCVPPDNGVYTVKGRVQDADGGVTEYAGSLTVANVAPTATLTLPSKPVPEGSTFTVSLTKLVDASVDLSTLRFAFACGANMPLSPFGTYTSWTCSGPDNGPYTVSAAVVDKDGGRTDLAGTVQIVNVAPTVTVTSTAVGTGVGTGATRFTAGVTFKVDDPAYQFDFVAVGASLSYPTTIAWGDGSTSNSFGSRNVTGVTHTYAKIGNYTVTLSASDKDGGVGTTTVKVAIK